ncbi:MULTISPECIES: DUF192 domain-containing protein [Chromohalobacter]|jgi:uncharacterized membrane protein (UPF0127 family)|uniref:DUF192 domain-containing protein n=1 Tax=Chromohalobacter israelensis (strain ATCC BAA-138 / DSM 3043 / CIP 106854 / NCIMB 13768 / 1H11) TaxID=290398 RepID=Q1QU38_CHRI1|nr:MULTISPECIES: DUF192 domain-containing protein [Chromohalobacter]ABE60020.1 protein of unknown function DUF192 [Chromohalobacter salexigens DSM 3043]MDO0945821.1 DUF192 domain-containing protein [Chromohalobacter salexigens]NQY44978.1 DUF192 domain-containing protein [Chromohalobacter sp.]
MMRMKYVLLVAWGGLLWMSAGAGQARAGLDHVTLTFAEHQLSVEVARQPQERARGLMGRETLAPDAGMLFVYARQQPPTSSFWMYRTLIPLDIAFLGADGEIRAIRRMLPCRTASREDCPRYAAGAPFRAALEVNAGYFSRHGLEVGDRLPIAALLPSR